MDTIRISAKNLGYTALADFCPRCYWIRLKANWKLPWSSFPGIFASIDSYTKKTIHHIIDSSNERESRQVKSNSDYYEYPQWLSQIGDIASYEKIVHWSKNTLEDKKSGIILSGMPDDILIRRDGSKAIIDWKTAVYSKNQDALMPIYLVQINVYAILSGDTATDLYLVYMEPQTTGEFASNSVIDCGFSMCFHATVVPVANDRSIVRQALSLTREIYELPTAPEATIGCKNCSSLDTIIELLK